MQQGLYQQLHIREVQEEVEGFKTITFEDGHGISYKAGQYLTLVRFTGTEELRRSYSITSSPLLNEPLSIGVKRVENGAFSRHLVDHAQPGDVLRTTGSGGLFVLPDEDEDYNQLFFFAAGSGITPVYSLIKTALRTSANWRIVLVYSNASVEKTIFRNELLALEVDFANRFHLEFLYSNSPHLAKARLHRDLIFSFVAHYVSTPNYRTLFYTCGPESYMRLCTYTLQEAGIDPSDIKKENFYASNLPKRDAAPPDQQTHTATIRLQGNEYKVVVHYPNSILRAAKTAGLSLPYSCEAGRCGNCVARCLSGAVWHSYNEVLTEKELQQGLVLTCVGHPVGGDVVLQI